MTETSPPDFGPSYWVDTADEMATRLERVVKFGCVEPRAIPRRRLDHARLLFTLALQGRESSAPEAANAYLMAVRIAKAANSHILPNGRQIEGLFARYLALLESLQQPRELTEQEVYETQGLRKFLLKLRDEGIAERHELQMRKLRIPTGSDYTPGD